MAKTEKLFSKIGMIVFLILIVLGFTVPGFINSDQNNLPPQVEPRICQSDAECYLICDEKPFPVLCAQNLCQQNECGFSYFEYNRDEAVTFKLDVVVDSGTREAPNVGKLDLISRNNAQNFFVTFAPEDKISIFSSRLNLNLVLDKVNVFLYDKCIKVDTTSYCENDDFFLSILVNNEESELLGDYIPQNGDDISISYLARNQLNDKESKK